ncbi:hypothetical protein CAPTEDRAFT_212407 [Capitella teleta]|uniref:G-protein coupled receptors family 1 profile domain-containing protein n=1 Tax=Capitella teleta TaxID=283909 RepID=R7U4W6_CAPTE|nr:hypothetical protein CAPTEDRAFT_212407 [Capitella teleta]|eukprot:ELT98200.1 hypothetical protein CAPTEDRAFT_212407 [Capitella teleta]
MAAGNETPVGLPVFGLPGDDFYILHGLALCSLGLSIIASTFVLVYLLFFASNKPVRRRQIGERLVVYLAIYDLCFSISHSLDHSYMMATLSNPPDYICVPFAFLLHQFTMAQSLLVLFTSVNAMTMVVLNRKLDLGHNDWKLFLITLGVPASAGVVGVSVPYLGPSGSWNVNCLLGLYSYSENTLIAMSTSNHIRVCFYSDQSCGSEGLYK